MKTTKEYITLPAAVYDALNLSALYAKGVGTSCLAQQEVVKGKVEPGIPVCIIGHALFLDGAPNGFSQGEEIGPVTKAVAAAFGFPPRAYANVYAKNDEPVTKYLEDKYGGGTTKVQSYGENTSTPPSIFDDNVLDVERKVSWKQWCKLVGVVRGDK